MDKMKIYELEIKMYLLKNIQPLDSLEKIAYIIDQSLIKDNIMKTFHNSQEYKGYVFNSFYPLEAIYKEGNIYTVKLRVLGEKLKEYFFKNLPGIRSEEIQVLTVTGREVKKHHILSLYNITPAICKFENGYWKENYGIDVLEKRIKENALKKYKYFIGEELEEDFTFIKKIILKNTIPIGVKYKNIKLLGDKMDIEIDNNLSAQKLAYIIFATGLLELGARGYGYINTKYIKL